MLWKQPILCHTSQAIFDSLWMYDWFDHGVEEEKGLFCIYTWDTDGNMYLIWKFFYLNHVSQSTQ